MLATPIVVSILLAGVVIVVGGILWLRLPAFLALLLAALTVSVLTPDDAVRQAILDGKRLELDRGADAETGPVFLAGPNRSAAIGEQIVLFDHSRREPLATVRVVDAFEEADGNRTVRKLRTVWVGDPLREPFDELADPHGITFGEFRAASKTASSTVGARLASGFGSTCAKIGILIAMASIIGKCLLDSGAADRIVRSAARLLGERGTPAAFAGSGFLLAIPVFFDTVFYLMIPLGKAMRMRTGKNYLLYVLTIIVGGTMAHSLIPPTPGPLLVAGELGVDIGLMMIVGLVVGSITVLYGLLHASLMNRYFELPLRESADLSLADLEQIASRPENELPPLWLGLLPIVLPVVLIGGRTITAGITGIPNSVTTVLATVGEKNVALIISAAIAIGMLIRQRAGDFSELSSSLQSALASAGTIILITAAGGAFGASLQQTGIATILSRMSGSDPLVVLILAWTITVAIRTAQGSSTVAMITAVGVLAGLADPQVLGFHPVYLAIAIGCGSKPFSWMNDSGFWVITRLSGMTEAEGLRYITPMTAIMGFIGLLATIVGAKLFPMV